MSTRRNAFFASVVVHAVLLCTVLLVPLIFTDTITTKRDYVELALVAPPLTRPVMTPPPQQPQPRLVAPKVQRPTPQIVRAEVPLPLPTPKPAIREERKIETPKPAAPPPVVRSAGFDRVEAAPVAAPRAVVRTGSFSDSTATTGEVGATARMVQTGGFGDPNGVTGKGRPDKIANIASLGSFDLPSGGERGGGGRERGTGRSVQSAGFGDLNEQAPAPASVSRDTGPPETPVEILSKPRPDYTEAARQLRVEGEVLIRVLFRATGEIRILEVMRSLGHGLDQNAVRAAQQIRFKPASRKNQPVDSTATVHIVFQLAY